MRHRAEILAAAREVFSEAGYHGAGLEEVALRAGISRKTVYYQFGSKMGLLDALLGDLETSADLAERIQAIIQRPARIAIPEYFREACRFWQHNHQIMRALTGLAATDNDAQDVVDKHDHARRRRLVKFIELLAGRGELREDYAHKHAVDLLWLLSSFGSYDQLARRSRLSAEAAASLLSEAAFVLMRPTDS